MPNWKIETPSGSVSIEPEMLVNQLSAKIAESDKPDIDLLTFTLARYLETNSVLHTLRPIDLINMSMLAGYYYHVFLTKNKVEFIVDNPEPNQTNQNDG